MSSRARRRSRRLGLKKGFRREAGPTPRHRIRGRRDGESSSITPSSCDDPGAVQEYPTPAPTRTELGRFS
jgi:hypothetical protein